MLRELKSTFLNFFLISIKFSWESNINNLSHPEPIFCILDILDLNIAHELGFLNIWDNHYWASSEFLFNLNIKNWYSWLIFECWCVFWTSNLLILDDVKKSWNIYTIMWFWRNIKLKSFDWNLLDLLLVLWIESYVEKLLKLIVVDDFSLSV